MGVDHYRSQGGVLPRLSTLSGVAAHQRVLGRQTGAPLTDPLLFGVSGGVGASYSVRRDLDGSHHPHVDLSPRYRGGPSDGLHGMCVRLGLPVSFRHIAGAAAAERGVRAALERGDLLIAYLAADELPYLASPGAWLDGAVRPVVLVGLVERDGEDHVLVADLCGEPFELSLPEFRRAWGGSPGGRLLIAAVDAPASPVDLPKAIEAGLRICCDRMVDPPHPRQDFGLPALGRLGRVLSSSGDPESWRVLLGSPADIYLALRDLFVAIELGEAGPQGGRVLFATFLGEAAEVLQGPDLSDAIRSYERLGAAWRAVASAALPSSNEALADLRELLLARGAMLRGAPGDVTGSIEDLGESIAALDARCLERPPVSAAEAGPLFEELGARLVRIAADEEAAVSSLRLALR